MFLPEQQLTTPLALQVHVVMKPNHLRFSLDGLSIIDGKLREPIHPSESTWQIGVRPAARH